IEVAGRDQPVVAQDLLNVPNGTAIEKERGCDRMSEHVRGHGLRKPDGRAKATKPGKCDLLFKPFALSTYDKKGFAAVLPPQQVFLHPTKRPWAEKYHALFVAFADDGRLPRLEIYGRALERQGFRDAYASAEKNF